MVCSFHYSFFRIPTHTRLLQCPQNSVVSLLQCFLSSQTYHSPGKQFERFRGVLEFISRFEFDFRVADFF